MKKVKIYGIDTWVPEDKQEQDSISAMAEVQGHAVLLHFGKILRPKTSKMKRFLSKTTLVITFIFASCSEEIGPCYEHEQQCKVLLSKMNQATTEAEKEQYRQFYLAEKHLLDYCNSQK